MEFKQRAELVKKIRMGDLEAIKMFILYIHEIILTYPMELYETYYYRLNDKFKYNFELRDTKNIYLLNSVLHLIEDVDFLSWFEEYQNTENLNNEIFHKLNFITNTLVTEFKIKDKDEIYTEIIKLLSRSEKNEKTYISDKNTSDKRLTSNIRKFIHSENEYTINILNSFLDGAQVSIISKFIKINLKTVNNILYKNLKPIAERIEEEDLYE